MIYSALHIFFYILTGIFSVFTLYLFILAITGLFYRSKPFLPVSPKKRIAVLITSFREDEVIVNTVRSATEHNYPASHFNVFVAADQLQPETIAELAKFRAQTFEVQFRTGSKARSLNFLLNKIDEQAYDVAVILDGDNIMMPGFLEKINATFQKNNTAVQAHRTAKNLNTPVAILDAISEEVNNHLFRKAPVVMGLSSSLIGSGMAFTFNQLKQIYNKPGILDNPACDREVDFEMLKSGSRIVYIDEAFVLDEKVSSEKVYKNQRRRWLESQLMHVGLFFSQKMKRRSADFWNKLFINLIPPRILMLSVFFLMFCMYLLQYFLNDNLVTVPYQYWVVLFIFYATSILLAVPSRFYTFYTVKSFIYLPALLFAFMKAVFTIRRKRKEFVHTPKSYTGDSASTKSR